MTKRSNPARPPSDDASGLNTPVRTPPLDDAQREARYDGPDAIIALREYETDHEYELSLEIKTYRLGGSRLCEVSIPGRGLSAIHCLLERRGTRFLVHDLNSTHGTSREGRKIDVADLHPGDCFTAAPMTFVALNREMRLHRPLLVELLGTDFAPWSPDKLMIQAVRGSSHLLITGEAGCEHARLAHAIHAMSLRRARPLVECAKIPADRASQVALIRHAGKSTLMITLGDKTRPLDPTFSSMLFAPGYHVRVIMIAPTAAAARRVLPDEQVDQMQHVWIRPIGVRAGELPTIFDRLLVERDAQLRLAALTSKNREALFAHAWRGNWEELRTAADRLTAIARVSSWDSMDWRDRAAAIGIAKSTLHDWYRALKLTAPLLA